MITFKFAAKAIAPHENLHATFMAKPIGGINGTGMHTHGSLTKDGKNVFYDANGDHDSQTCRHCIGGLLDARAVHHPRREPDINSYKRLVPGYEAPVYVSWSTANRSALIRVPAPRVASRPAPSSDRLTQRATRT